MCVSMYYRAAGNAASNTALDMGYEARAAAGDTLEAVGVERGREAAGDRGVLWPPAAAGEGMCGPVAAGDTIRRGALPVTEGLRAAVPAAGEGTRGAVPAAGETVLDAPAAGEDALRAASRPFAGWYGSADSGTARAGLGSYNLPVSFRPFLFPEPSSPSLSLLSSTPSAPVTPVFSNALAMVNSGSMPWAAKAKMTSGV
jgi:hypothetical protein